MANLKYWDTATSSWKIVAVGELGATGPTVYSDDPNYNIAANNTWAVFERAA